MRYSTQDPNYDIEVDENGARLVNSHTGVALAADMPVMIFLGKDRHALNVINFYDSQCNAPQQAAEVEGRAQAFKKCAEENYCIVKEPGTSIGGSECLGHRYKDVLVALCAALGGRHEFSDYLGLMEGILAVDSVVDGRNSRRVFNTEYHGVGVVSREACLEINLNGKELQLIEDGNAVRIANTVRLSDHLGQMFLDDTLKQTLEHIGLDAGTFQILDDVIPPVPFVNMTKAVPSLNDNCEVFIDIDNGVTRVHVNSPFWSAHRCCAVINNFYFELDIC